LEIAPFNRLHTSSIGVAQ